MVAEILRGGAEKCREAGVVIAGGHSVQDAEPKYGMVVLGIVPIEKTITKGGARPGDALVLSKPIGFGVTTTALRSDLADPTDVSEAVGWMKRLNKTASQLAVQIGVRSGTDITGYSLLGHAQEIAAASRVGLRFWYDRIPMTRGAVRYAKEWIFPGGASDNRQYFGKHISFDEGIEEFEQMLLFDPQTSGGLLFAVPRENLPGMMEEAAKAGQPLWEIGEVFEGEGIQVTGER